MRPYRSTQRADELDNVRILMDFLIKTLSKNLIGLRDVIVLLLQNMKMPIRLGASSDVVRYFENISNYIGFMGK